MSTFHVIVHFALTAAADGDERHLAERDLPRPAREHHQRQPDGGEDGHGGGLDDLVGAQHERDEREPDHDQGCRCPAHEPHERKAGDPRLEWTDLIGEAPSGCLVSIGPAVLATLEEQCDEDRGADDRHHQQRRAGVPCNAVLENAERHRGGGHCRQMPETTDDERREGLNESSEAERGTERHAEDSRAQEQREERQAGRNRPDERRQPGDRDAEHQCPLAAFG